MLELFGGLEHDLEDTLPSGRFELGVHRGAADGLTGAAAVAAQHSIACWVSTTARSIAISRPGAADIRQGSPPEVPAPVMLQRWPTDVDGARSLRLLLAGPEQMGSDRDSRLVRTLRSKCGKLENSRVDGSVTVLVLESLDIVMSNPVAITWAVHRATVRLVEEDRNFPVPDHLVLVHCGRLKMVMAFGRWSGAALSQPSTFDRG